MLVAVLRHCSLSASEACATLARGGRHTLPGTMSRGFTGTECSQANRNSSVGECECVHALESLSRLNKESELVCPRLCMTLVSHCCPRQLPPGRTSSACRPAAQVAELMACRVHSPVWGFRRSSQEGQ